jgi:RHS repeat-associated protein
MAGISSCGNLRVGNNKKFNGIEHTNDLDLNQYDAFYRTMDPQIGRWWQVDPKIRDDEGAYNAMGNNPIKFSDYLGDVFHLNGSKEDVDTYINYLNQTTGNKYKVNKNGDLVRTNKKLNAKTTDKISGTLSKDVDKAIKSKETVTFNLINNDIQDKTTYLDSYKSGNVDMKDLAKIKDKDFLAGVIGHDLEESMQVPDISKRDLKSKEGKAVYDAAHLKGEKKEGQIVTEMNNVANMKRPDVVITTPQMPDGSYRGVYTYDYGSFKFQVTRGATAGTLGFVFDINKTQK